MPDLSSEFALARKHTHIHTQREREREREREQRLNRHSIKENPLQHHKI